MKELNILYNILADNSILLDVDFLDRKHFAQFGEEFGLIKQLYSEVQHVDKISLDMHDVILPKLEDFVPLRDRAILQARQLFDSYHRNLVIGQLKGLEAVNYDDLREQVLEILEESDSAFENDKAEETIENLLDPFFSEVNSIREGGEPIGMQLKTLPQMNEIIGGILPTDLIGIYGKEKSSKSTLAMEMMLDLCVDQKHGGAIFSYEMSNKLVLMKAISLRTGIDINHLRNPDKRWLSDSDFQKYVGVAGRVFFDTNLYLIDQLLDEYQIETKCKKLADRGVKIVLIDYLMLVSSRQKHDSVRNELNYLSKFFKRMAQKLNIAVILISQANDTGEREAEAKGLSRDSNYYFYVAALTVGDKVMHQGKEVYTCVNEGEYVVKNRGLRHGKLGSFFITTFENNLYKEKREHHFKENLPI